MYIAYLSIPYIGLADDAETTTRNWAHMTFQSEEPISKRKIKRAIRKWAKYTLERTLHCSDVQMLLKLVRFECSA
jgi:hypothetical protein